MLDREGIRVLVVPPWEGAGEDHWMTHWQRKYPWIERVEQSDWNSPRRSEWVSTLDMHVSGRSGPVVLVAHSLGAATVLWWAQSGGTALGAFLVAPPDLEQENTPAEIAEFGPLPLSRLTFPSVLVASENDPYVSMERARDLAEAWGSELLGIGPAGHVNPRSGYGQWQEGEELLADFIAKLTSSQVTAAV